MKILVISDTHGAIHEIVKVIENMEKPQLILHLGDYVEDGEKIEKETGIKVEMVRGNGDFFNKRYEDDKVLEIEGKRIFMTHGHRYGVRHGVLNLLYRAEELQADIVLYGHTHVPMITKDAGIFVMNPGSPTHPRGFYKSKTYGIINIKDTIDMTIEKIKF